MLEMMSTDCAKSLELLSDFRDDALDETLRALVHTHLSKCVPCMGIFRDLDAIIVAATVLRVEEGLTFPDEDALWQRMNIGTH